MKLDGIEYYARDDEEKDFDREIRDAIKKSGDTALMALYMQNQAILSLLRKHDDEFHELQFQLRHVR